jgi:hypothetical protein
MSIDYDSDLIKHFVRTDGWLPTCRRRLNAIRNDRPRRMRYFTFCAVGAVDVLMLDVANIVKRSPGGNRFDTVCFFGRDGESIVQTQKRIPGAIGFPGDFVELVLLYDDDEILLADNVDPLDAPEEDRDEAHVRLKQHNKGVRRAFMKQFPFDVMNLDLEEYVFKPKEELPGKMIKALRKVFAWQRRPLVREIGPPRPISEFSLMFTTQIGPPGITADCVNMLEECLRQNVTADDRLLRLLSGRAGVDDVVQLKQQQFDLFFKLALPKIIAAILLEEDWYVDPTAGITIYQYARNSLDGPYQMLNFVMDVRRQNPPRETRLPLVSDRQTREAKAAYQEVAFKLFRDPEKMVSEGNLDAEAIRKSLDLIKSRRKKYCPEDIA